MGSLQRKLTAFSEIIYTQRGALILLTLVRYI